MLQYLCNYSIEKFYNTGTLGVCTVCDCILLIKTDYTVSFRKADAMVCNDSIGYQFVIFQSLCFASSLNGGLLFLPIELILPPAMYCLLIGCTVAPELLIV